MSIMSKEEILSSWKYTRKTIRVRTLKVIFLLVVVEELRITTSRLRQHEIKVEIGLSGVHCNCIGCTMIEYIDSIGKH